MVSNKDDNPYIYKRDYHCVWKPLQERVFHSQYALQKMCLLFWPT